MSLKNFAAVGLIAAATLAAGCDNADTTTPADTTATPSAGAVNDNAMTSAENLERQGEAAGDRIGAAMGDATTRASAAMDGAATRASGAAGDASSAVVTQAQSLYTQAQTAISSAKFEDAQKHVDQLKGLRDKLPAEWQTRVDQLVKSLSDARARLGNMPATPR